jgi:hypothetical protein
MTVTLKGIYKIEATALNIQDCIFFNDLQAESSKRNLVKLNDDKLHVTLIHQSCLKTLSKAVKKGQELIQPELPILNLNKGIIGVAMDLHPRTNETRETVRLLLCDEDQESLKTYVNEFCALNGVELNALEEQRVFHISFSNRTGEPGDSVR